VNPKRLRRVFVPDGVCAMNVLESHFCSGISEDLYILRSVPQRRSEAFAFSARGNRHGTWFWGQSAGLPSAHSFPFARCAYPYRSIGDCFSFFIMMLKKQAPSTPEPRVGIGLNFVFLFDSTSSCLQPRRKKWPMRPWCKILGI
jgi:hypothetical protein